MSWSAQVFRYCERGADPAFWGEPLNAVTNAAFVVGGLVALMHLAQAREGRSALAEQALALLVIVIGIGSFLFHTFATRWAAIADVAPIGVFMLAYLGYALRIYLRWGRIATGIGLAMFVAALQAAGHIQCQRGGLLGIAEASRGPCLNGTLGYLPAWLAMAGIGAVTWMRGHPSAPLLLAAAGIFLVSMAFRTVDLELCPVTRLAARPLGTHFLWHLCNAATLYLLLQAAVRARHRRETA
jgi:hypothetical protein